MGKSRRVWLTLVLAGLAHTAKGAFEWHNATPESRKLSTVAIDEFKALQAQHGTTAFLLIADDRIVYEWYAHGHAAAERHYTASMAKALVGGMAVAVALDDGRLSLDDPAAKFIPQWRDDPAKARITLRELGSHTSGISDAEGSGADHVKAGGWQGDFWKRLPPPRDPFTLARDAAPLRFTPGVDFLYSNPGMAILAYATTAALRDAPEKDLRSLLRDRVMRPIGVADGDWDVGYGQTFVVDDLPLVAIWGGGEYTARATARIGRLMLREGDWDGRRVLTPEAVHAVTRDAGTPHNGAIGWWSNNDGTVPELPRDAYWGAGAGHQVLLVIPSRKIIVVRNGETLDRTQSYDDACRRWFFAPLMKAIASPSDRSAD